MSTRSTTFLRACLLVAAMLVSHAPAADVTTTVTLTEQLGWTHDGELVWEDLTLEPGAQYEPAAAVLQGQTLQPSQAAVLARHADGSIATLRVYWLASLAAGETREYTVTAREMPIQRVYPRLRLTRGEGTLTIADGDVAVTLPDGVVPAGWPRATTVADAPIQGLRLPGGVSLGPSRIAAPFQLISRETVVLTEGPLLTEVELRYVFSEGFWNFRVSMVSGQGVVRVDETLNLGHAGQDGAEIDRMLVLPVSGELAPESAWFAGNVVKADTFATLQKGAIPHSELVTSWSRASWFNSPVNGVAAGAEALRGQEIARITGFPSVLPRVGVASAVMGPQSALGLIMVDPELWYNPTSVRLRADADGGLAYHFPIQRYKQNWETDGFGDGSPNYTGLVRGVPPNEVRRSYLLTLAASAGLDGMALMTTLLEQSRVHGAYPLQELRAIPIELPDPMADAAWADASSEAGTKALEQMRLGVAVKGYFGDFANVSMAYHFNFARNKVPLVAPVIDSTADLSAADRAELRRLVAFYNYDMHQRQTFPYGNGFHLNNPNMTIMAVEARAKTALLMKDHPQFAEWGTETRQILADYIPRYTFDSGAPYENPHYTLGVTLQAGMETNKLLMENGMGDAFDQPLFDRCMHFVMNWLTPPERRYYGYRVLLPIGNGSYQSVPQGIGNLMVEYYSEKDPELAAQLQWFANATVNEKQQKGKYKHIDIMPESKRPELKSAVFADYGAFFRHGFGTEHETLFHILAGKADGHNEWETDQLSYTLYAKGQPIHLDFGNGYFPMYGRPWLRNRISWDMKIEQSERNPSGIDQSRLSDSADYIRAFRVVDQLWDVKNEYPPLDPKTRRWLPEENLNRQPPREMIDIPSVTWYRQVLFMKDPDPAGPNYFVLRESFEGRSVKPTELNLWFLASEMQTVDEQTFHFVGQQPVDMDVFVHTPQEFTPHTDSYGHQNQPYVRLTGDDLSVYPDKKRWEEQLLLRVNQPPGDGYMVVLYPRLKEGDPAATYRRLAPNVVEVKTPAGVDTIFMSAFPFEYQGEGIGFQGQAGALRRHADGSIEFINLAGTATFTGADVPGGKLTLAEPGNQTVAK